MTGELTRQFKMLEDTAEEMRVGAAGRISGQTVSPVMGADSGKRRTDFVSGGGESASLKQLTDLRKKATDEANKEEVRRLNIAIWVNEQIALSEQKKNDEIAMYTERRMDIEQKRANENFEEAQRIYKQQLDEEQRLVEDSKKGFEDLERAIDGYAKNASAAMTDFIFGSKSSFSDMVNSMLKDLARLALQKSIFDPLVEGISGSLGGSGGIGGFFKSLLPGFANGTEYVPKDMIANIHQGERVLTREENRNYSQGMSGNVSVNVNVNSDGSSSVQSDASFGKQLGNAIKATVQAELLKQKRQGGLLA
jgi:flagellar hook-basal body complex protein FliE